MVEESSCGTRPEHAFHFVSVFRVPNHLVGKEEFLSVTWWPVLDGFNHVIIVGLEIHCYGDPTKNTECCPKWYQIKNDGIVFQLQSQTLVVEGQIILKIHMENFIRNEKKMLVTLLVRRKEPQRFWGRWWHQWSGVGSLDQFFDLYICIFPRFSHLSGGEAKIIKYA